MDAAQLKWPLKEKRVDSVKEWMIPNTGIMRNMYVFSDRKEQLRAS